MTGKMPVPLEAKSMKMTAETQRRNEKEKAGDSPGGHGGPPYRALEPQRGGI
jgi:hypothetical protein